MVAVKLEVLHIDECPNWAEAESRARTALDSLGLHAVVIEDTLLTSSADAAGTAFAGSPTILINGADAFPDGARTSDLACRVYATPTGFAGVPTPEQIAAAIQRVLG